MHSRLYVVVFLLMTCGCITTGPVNPSFPVTAQQAGQALDDATAHPKPLARPLVIIGGFVDPGWAASGLSEEIRACTHDDRILTIPMNFDMDFEVFRQRIIQAVNKAFPSTDPYLTTDVDVVGVSMGGVAARYAAINPLPGRRLQIHRMFTISSPHSGCLSLTKMPLTLVPALEQIRVGSPMLQQINTSSDPNTLFPIYCYAMLDDIVIGEQYCAPPMQRAWWVSRWIFFDSHAWSCWRDPRIRADIVRRLRYETPLTIDPPAPLPS